MVDSQNAEAAHASGIRRFFSAYAKAYQGLDPRTWRLTFGIFIQRAGTMVLPFLTIYLAKEAKMSEAQVASVVMYHGLGAVVGSFLATQTVARYSMRSNMLGSLIATGVSLLALYFSKGYLWISVFAAAMMLCEAPFRPAVMTQVSRIEPAKNQAQAVALIRVGVNAGMMLGPAIGGLLALIDYAYLFYIDAATCIMAAIWLSLCTKAEDLNETKKEKASPFKSTALVLKDRVFLLLWLAQLFQFLVIFQLISTLPLFLSQERSFDEAQIGRYFLINGLIILGVEMWLVRAVRRLDPALVFGIGAFTMALGIAAVEFLDAPWIIYTSVIAWTLGEMVSMPIINSIVIARAKEHSAAYLSWFSTATNVAMVVAGPSGLWIAHHYGYTSLWSVVAGLGLGCLVLGMAIKRAMART